MHLPMPHGRSSLFICFIHSSVSADNTDVPLPKHSGLAERRSGGPQSPSSHIPTRGSLRLERWCDTGRPSGTALSPENSRGGHTHPVINE